MRMVYLGASSDRQPGVMVAPLLRKTRPLLSITVGTKKQFLDPPIRPRTARRSTRKRTCVEISWHAFSLCASDRLVSSTRGPQPVANGTQTYKSKNRVVLGNGRAPMHVRAVCRTYAQPRCHFELEAELQIELQLGLSVCCRTDQGINLG